MKRVVAENEKQLREEIEAKRQKICEPGKQLIDISFNSDSAMEVELKREQLRKQRSLTIYFTHRMLNHHSMRLTSLMTMR